MHLAIDCTYQCVAKSPGGGATYLIELVPRLCEQLRRHGDTLTIFCAQPDRVFYEEMGAKTIVLPTEPSVLRGISTHCLVPLKSKALKVDVLLQPGNFGSVIKTTKQVVVAQSLLTFKHFPEELGIVKTLYRRVMLRLTTSRSDGLVFLSRAQQCEFASYYKRMGPNVVIYPGAPEVPSVGSNRKKWILVVSSFWQYKNIDGILEIANGLRERDLKIPIIIIGDGPQFERYKDQVSQAGLDDFVILEGSKPLAEIYKLYPDAALTIHLSRAESFGFPVLESMKFGVPVLISDQAAMTEVAAEAGCVISCLDDAMKWIERLVTDDAMWRQVRSSVLARASAFSWEKTAMDMVSFCKSV